MTNNNSVAALEISNQTGGINSSAVITPSNNTSVSVPSAAAVAPSAPAKFDASLIKKGARVQDQRRSQALEQTRR